APRPAGNPKCGRVFALALTRMLILVTSTPPSDANACVIPSQRSFCFRSSNISANQVIAAINSTQTPMKVVLRKNTNIGREVENEANGVDGEHEPGSDGKFGRPRFGRIHERLYDSTARRRSSVLYALV